MNEMVGMILRMADDLKEMKVMIQALKQSRTERFRAVWVDGPEVERLLGISTRTLQHMRDRGEIPYSRLCNKMFYKLADIEALLERGYGTGEECG